MKKTLMMCWIAVLAVVAGGCLESEGPPVEETPVLGENAHGGADGLEGEPLSAEQWAEREGARELPRGPGDASWLSLELEEEQSRATGQLKDDAMAAAGLTCYQWSDWYTIDTFCEWATMCFFGDATYLARERSRTCCYPGSCFVDFDYTSVRNKCGC